SCEVSVMRVVTGITVLLLAATAATAAPRTKEHEWTSAERAVRSETLEQEVEAALEAALENEQEEEQILVTEKSPVFVTDEDDQIHPEVKPQDGDYVVPSYSPVGSENEFGSEDTSKLTPSLILDIEKRLQAEMGQMEGQLSLLHTLVSSIFGSQAPLNPKEDFDPNVVVVNVPQQQGGVGDHNPFNFGFDPSFNDHATDNDDSNEENDDAWDPWFKDRPEFPSLSDVFGIADSQEDNTFGLPDFGFSNNETGFGFPNFFGDLPNEWANLPSNYSNSTHEIQHVNGSVIAVNETINHHSGDGYNFFVHKQVINVLPEDLESPKDSNKETGEEIEEETEKETEGAEENNGENVIDDESEDENIEENKIITRNENELGDGQEDIPLVENKVESEFSEFQEFKTEAENDIEDEVSNSIQAIAL
ncbi:unnamed protein product, partial [Meganyctiphanes norvegica]